MASIKVSQLFWMMSKKMQILRDQEKLLSQALGAWLDLMQKDIEQKLGANSIDTQCVFMDFYKLDCLSEFLGTILLKLQDDSFLQDQTEHELCQVTTGCDSQKNVLNGNVNGEQEQQDLSLEENCAFYSMSQEENEKATHSHKNNNQKRDKVGSSQSQDLKLAAHVFQCLADVEEIKLAQAATEADVAESCQKSHNLETVVRDLKKQVDLLAEEKSCLSAQLKRVTSRHKTLKKSVKKREIQEKGMMKLLIKRVSSLEVLRNILNEKRDTRKIEFRQTCQDNFNKLAKIEQDLLSFDKRMNTVARPSIGFTAQLKDDRRFDSTGCVMQMYRIISNVGNTFHAATGAFIAPHDGLYGFCVKMEQKENKAFTIALVTKTGKGNPVREMEVALHWAAPHSAFCVLDLPKSATVSLNIELASGTVDLKSSLTFSGWSIGYE